MVGLMGTNHWKYGVEANRKELEAITRYVLEQGLVKHQIGFEEMFAPQALALEEDSGSKDTLNLQVGRATRRR